MCANYPRFCRLEYREEKCRSFFVRNHILRRFKTPLVALPPIKSSSWTPFSERWLFGRQPPKKARLTSVAWLRNMHGIGRKLCASMRFSWRTRTERWDTLVSELRSLRWLSLILRISSRPLTIRVICSINLWRHSLQVFATFLRCSFKSFVQPLQEWNWVHTQTVPYVLEVFFPQDDELKKSFAWFWNLTGGFADNVTAVEKSINRLDSLSGFRSYHPDALPVYPFPSLLTAVWFVRGSLWPSRSKNSVFSPMVLWKLLSPGRIIVHWTRPDLQLFVHLFVTRRPLSSKSAKKPATTGNAFCTWKKLAPGSVEVKRIVPVSSPCLALFSSRSHSRSPLFRRSGELRHKRSFASPDIRLSDIDDESALVKLFNHNSSAAEVSS